jgi:glycosyltransferase involved in cell wall biosynthesis
VIEYMAAGLPVLTSLGGECRRLLEEMDCGGYYPPADARALADQLISGSEHEGIYVAQGRRARECFDRRFSATNVFLRMVGHVESLGRRP